MKSHRAGIDAMNREHHARNNDHKMGMRSDAHETATVGGSMKVNDPGPKGKSPSMGGSSDAKALGRAAAGRIESRPGKD